MLFSYRAKSKTGEILESIQDATSRFSLAQEIRAKGLTPLSIAEKRKSFSEILLIFSSIFSKVSMEEKIIFAKNLSGMLHAGLSLYRALLVLQKQTKNYKFNKILLSLTKDINAGETFFSALAKFPNVFSKLFVSMVRAGEESGNLSGALADISFNLEKTNSLVKKIRGALIYPSIIFGVMIIIGILMFAFLVPTLANTFREFGAVLPLSTRILIFWGDFFSNNLTLTFVIIIGIVLGLYAIFRARFIAPCLDFIAMKIPIVDDLVKELNTARTARTISSLLTSGTSLTRSLEITEEVVQNIYYQRVLNEAKALVEKGVPLSQALEENTALYPIMMVEMVEVGEETGQLSDMLSQIASFYEEEIENKTKNLYTVIEPLLMVIMGIGVGFFAISVISPLYSILDNIK